MVFVGYMILIIGLTIGLILPVLAIEHDKYGKATLLGCVGTLIASIGVVVAITHHIPPM